MDNSSLQQRLNSFTIQILEYIRDHQVDFLEPHFGYHDLVQASVDCSLNPAMVDEYMTQKSVGKRMQKCVSSLCSVRSNLSYERLLEGSECSKEKREHRTKLMREADDLIKLVFEEHINLINKMLSFDVVFNK